MPVDATDEVAAAARIASRHRLGMLLLLNPSAAIAGGVLLDALVSRDLLVAIFIPEYVNGLLHRGAVIVRGDRIERAGVPLSSAEVIKRASEFAAVVAVAVDEDTGEVRVMDRTGHVEVVEPDELANILRRHAE